jgi:prepilin-type N-terminal cleavage/methylation domain-containing protein
MLSKKGFTLVELMVTVAIVGILMAIVTSNFTTSRSRSRDAKRVSDINQIQLALELYFDRCDEYPATLSLTAKNGSCPTGIELGSFISKIPTAQSPGSYEYGVK